MIIKSIINSNDVLIETDSNLSCLIEISTFLGTLVFKDTITPVDNTIRIKGLTPGKYFLHISSEKKTIKHKISIPKN